MLHLFETPAEIGYAFYGLFHHNTHYWLGQTLLSVLSLYVTPIQRESLLYFDQTKGCFPPTLLREGPLLPDVVAESQAFLGAAEAVGPPVLALAESELDVAATKR